jgi:pimeloyl-ACP methyl ester carboxylesterase
MGEDVAKTMLTRRGFAALLAARKVAGDSPRDAILAAMEQVMGARPTLAPSPPAIRILGEERFASYTRRRIDYEAEPGDWVPAFLLAPETKDRPLPAAICLHQTTKIGKAEPAGDGPRINLHYAKELAERGFIALAPDYPNFGDYSIDVYERGYQSATMKGIFNHMRGVALLATMPEVAAHRIAAIGHSLGGHNALFLAAFDTRVRACVSSCGFTSFERYFGGDLTGWSHAGYMPRIASVYGKSPSKMPFDFADVLTAIAPRAAFINAPLRDSNFEVEGVRDCVRKAARHFAATRLVARYPDAAHDFPPDVRNEAYLFLKANLR